MLAEQVNPYTNEPISVSPLTWSHATVVSTAIKYLEKLEQLQRCDTCKQPMFRLLRRGPVEVKSQATFDRVEAGFDAQNDREMAASVAKFTPPGTPRRGRPTASRWASTRARLHRLRSVRRPPAPLGDPGKW